jgi:hypothetical protein
MLVLFQEFTKTLKNHHFVHHLILVGVNLAFS